MEAHQADSAATTDVDAPLTSKIRAQVEYYLSKQNLLQDHFLQSKMDKDYFVDLSVIAEFKLIKQLTTDLDLILSSIKDSDKIVIDEARKKIKPTTINQRTTLILRNIPTDAEKSAVEALLASVKVPKELAKTLKWGDKAIGVGIKSEKGIPLGASSAAQSTGGAGLPYYMPMNTGANGGYAAQNGGYNSLYVGGGDGASGNFRHGGRPAPGGRRAPGMNGANGGVAYEGGDNAKRHAGGKKGKGKGGREGGGRDGAEGGRAGAKETIVQAPINLADFPVLEANPTRKTDAHTKGGDAASQPEGSNSQSSASDAGTNDALSPTSPTKSGGVAVKKLSYAQMAQAAAQNAAAPAPPQPAAAGSAPAKASE